MKIPIKFVNDMPVFNFHQPLIDTILSSDPYHSIYVPALPLRLLFCPQETQEIAELILRQTSDFYMKNNPIVGHSTNPQLLGGTLNPIN